MVSKRERGRWAGVGVFVMAIGFFKSVMLAENTPEKKGPIAVMIGTRPEGIKMLPVYKALKESKLPVFLCSVGQHATLLSDLFGIFDVTPDCDLAIMKSGQDLFYVTEAVLAKVKELFIEIRPSLVLVQGDTTSAMVSALAAFYLKIPVGHVEAGLRTGDLYAPFPEEMNRRIISVLATYHFAPTAAAIRHLRQEGIREENVFYTGNTVVDALTFIQEKLTSGTLSLSSRLSEILSGFDRSQHKLILLTAHRRESFGEGLARILSSFKELLENDRSLRVIYPVHPNPAIRQALDQVHLEESPQIVITEPLAYTDLIYLLGIVDGVATDSGGIQEEAVSLGKPVLVLRDKTERGEGVQAGLAHLVGTDAARISKGVKYLLNEGNKRTNVRSTVYGDGHASERIVAVIARALGYDNAAINTYACCAWEGSNLNAYGEIACGDCSYSTRRVDELSDYDMSAIGERGG
jgi:UDP-N-acetylglucosamine 2-epimerase (non-hydrolysing)